MTRGRSIIRYLCIAGLLTCIVAVIAPAAYGGEGILPDAPEPPPVVTSTVEEVTGTVPSTEGAVEQVNTTTAPVTETVSNVGQSDAPVVEPVEDVVQNVPSTSVAVSTSTPDAPTSTTPASTAPSSNDAPATIEGSGGTTTGTGAGGTSSSSPTATGSGPSTRPAQTVPNAASSFVPPAERGSLRSAPGVFFAQAGDSPEEILNELLDIGNSVGIDQVRGLQITNARGSNNGAPELSGAPPTPAPLALTGIAIGAFLAIGLVLLATGNGARAAAGTSAA